MIPHDHCAIISPQGGTRWHNVKYVEMNLNLLGTQPGSIAHYNAGTNQEMASKENGLTAQFVERASIRTRVKNIALNLVLIWAAENLATTIASIAANTSSIDPSGNRLNIALRNVITIKASSL